MNHCIDCGKPCTGLRCAKDHGFFLFKQTLRETAAADAELLHMRDVSKLSFGRMAVRLGVSATAVQRRVANARRREKSRKEMGALL